MHSAFRQCLDEMDIDGMMKLARLVGQEPMSREQTWAGMHYARTQSDSISFAKRARSHAWLKERDLPSGLPDELKQQAEREYPRVVEAVGVSVRQLGNVTTPLTEAIERAMSDAVAECYADGERRPEIVKARMLAAWARVK